MRTISAWQRTEHLALTVSAASQELTATSLAGTPLNVPLTGDDGIMVADDGGTMSKRDKSVILAFLGIQAGRYVNNTAATQNTRS